MKKIFKIIYNIFFVFLILIALLLIISVLPITGNFKILTVLSGSMEPAIKMGSVVMIKQAGDYKINEVITFGKISREDTPTTHRIVDIKLQEGKPVYITKGDANNSPDTKEVLASEVAGKVVFTAPYIGYAVDFAKKPFGFMLIIIIPAAAIIYDEIRKIRAEVVKLKKKKNAENGMPDKNNDFPKE